MDAKHYNFFEIVDNFKEHEHIESIPIFENRFNDKSRFTIAIPTYKRGKFLKESLDSAINQDTDVPYEIIVCDNSPERDDDTEKLMMQYRDVPNLSYYKNAENLGMTGNWNRLIVLTRSDFFVMLHDDDVLAPYYIDCMNEFFEDMNPDIAGIATNITLENKFEIRPNSINYSAVGLRHLLQMYVLGAPIGTTYRTSIIKSLGGWNPMFFPSMDYCFDTLIRNYYPVIKVDMVGNFYRYEVNASLRKDVQIGCVIMDRRLRDALLKKYWVPSWFRKCWLDRRTKEHVNELGLRYNDIQQLNLKYEDSWVSILGANCVSYFTRCLTLISRIVKPFYETRW